MPVLSLQSSEMRRLCQCFKGTSVSILRDIFNFALHPNNEKIPQYNPSGLYTVAR